MDRRRQPAAIEIGYEPGSHCRVLRNLLGITLKRDIDRAEYDALVHAQEVCCATFTPEPRFTAGWIRALHRELLGQLYEWAGRYRTVELEKEGFRWPPAAAVPEEMAAFEETLLADDTPCFPA